MDSLINTLAQFDDQRLYEIIQDLEANNAMDDIVDLYRHELDRRWRQVLLSHCDCEDDFAHIAGATHPLNDIPDQQIVIISITPVISDYEELDPTWQLDSDGDEIPF
jgi:hypothetical protein